MIAQFESAGIAEALLNELPSGFPLCVLFPDAAQTLSALRASGFKLGRITNGSVRCRVASWNALALDPCLTPP